MGRTNLLLTLLFSLIFAGPSYSAITDGLGVGVGIYVPYAFKAQDDKDASTETFAFNPYISIHYEHPIWWGQFFKPELGFVFHSGNEDNTSKTTVFLRYNFAHKFNQDISLRYGLSTFMTKIGGDGGTVTLNNGTSTADFYAPSQTVTTYFSTLDLGAEYIATSNFGIRFGTQLMGVTSSEKRKLSYMLSSNLYF